MTLKTLNSEGGFGITNGNVIIDGNGNVDATNLSVIGTSNLGPVSNVIITGGANGQVLTTNGNGSLSWTETSSNSAAPMPYLIPSGTSFIVNENFQGLFFEPITIEGEFEVDGILVDLSGSTGGGQPGGNTTQVQFNNNGTFAGSDSLTFNTSTSTLTANKITITSVANLGSVANVKITGGNANFILRTDGNGNLTWIPNPGGSGTPLAVTVDNFTGNGVQTEFTLSVTPENVNYTTVNYNGVILLRTDYTVTGNVLTTSSPPANGSAIEVYTISGGGGGGGGNATPGGANTQIQFNDDGIFAGNAGFTFDKTTGVFSVPSISVSGNILPTSNIVYDLGSPNLRFNDLYLAGTTIELGNAKLGANATSLVLTNPQGGTFTVTGNGSASTTSIANGASNVTVLQNSVVIGSNGNASVLSVTGSDVGVQGTFGVSGNVTAQSNMSVSGNLVAANISTGGAIAATGNLSAGNISSFGDLSATGNVSAGNLSATGTLGVIGNTTLTGNFEVGGNTLLKSTTYVGSSNADITSVILYPNGLGKFNFIQVSATSNTDGYINTRDLFVTNNANVDTLNANTIGITGNVSATQTISAGNANLGNLVTANFFQGDGHLLTNITIQAGSSILNGNSNVSVAPNANVTISANGVANVVTIDKNGLVIVGSANISNGLSVTGNVEIINDVSIGGNVTTSKVKNGNTSINLIEDGNVSIVANGSTRITVSNSSVNIAGPANISGALSSGNITTGNIAANYANVNGNILSLNANLGNLVTANFFQGDGYLLTNLTIAAGSAIINGNSNVQVDLNGNVTITAAGNANVVTVTGNSVVLDKQLTGNLATFTTGNISTVNANTLNVQNQLTVNSNITANGALNANRLVIKEDISNGFSGGGAFDGNLTTQSNLFVSGYANVSSINTNNIQANSIQANTSVSSNNVTAQILLKSNGNLTVTGNSNLQAVTATTGNFSSNITSLNANLGNAVSANYFIGDGYLLTNLTIPAGTALLNGTSNLYVDGNGNIRLSVVGTPNVFVVSNNSAILQGNFTANGNINGTNLNVGGIQTNNINVTANLTTANISANAISSNGNIVSLNGNMAALNANLGNLVTANFFQGDGYLLTNLTIPSGTAIINGSSNVLVTANSDVNITVEGVANVVKVTAEGVIVTGNLRATNGISNGTTNINMLQNSDISMNVGGTANVFKISTSGVNANVKLNAFNGLAVTGNSNVANLGSSGNVTVAGEVAAGSFDTSGTLKVAGNSNIANLYATGNITAVGTVSAGNLTTTGVANVSSLIITSDGANISGNTTLTGVLNVQNDAIITGNLTIQGNTNYVNTDNLIVEDPIISLGGGPNGAPLTTNDGKDRGTSLQYYTTAPVTAFMGWDNSNAEFGFGSNVSITNEVVTFSNYGNLRANYFLGNIIGNISGNYTAPGSNTNILFNDAGQINGVSGITFDKTSNLLSTGNVTIATNLTMSAGTSNGVIYRNSSGQLVTNANLTFNGSNLSITGGAIADNFYGNLVKGNSNIVITSNSNISMFVAGNSTARFVATTTGVEINGNINVSTNGTFGNLYANSGNIVATLLTGTLTTAAQPNVTSLGTLSSLSVTGNISSGNVNAGNLLTANFVSGTLTTAAQPNITSIGVLSSLSVTGNITTGNLSGANLVSANLVTGTLTTAAQPNITSIGVLSSLAVTGNVSFGGPNVSLGNVSNLKITGGTANYVLSTDGTGNLSWVAQSGGGGGTANIAILDDGVTLTNTVSSINFTGDGVTATNVGNAVTVNINAGGGGGGGPAAITLDNFTGNGVQTQFTLSVSPVSENYTFVNIDGVSQLKTAYSVSGNVLTLSEAPVNGAKIEVTTVTALSNGQPSFTTRTYTGDGVQTTFTVTSGVTSTGILVTENGILQTPETDYTVSGSTLTFTTAPANNQAIQIRELGTVVSTTSATSARALGYSLVFGL